MGYSWVRKPMVGGSCSKACINSKKSTPTCPATVCHIVSGRLERNFTRGTETWNCLTRGTVHPVDPAASPCVRVLWQSRRLKLHRRYALTAQFCRCVIAGNHLLQERLPRDFGASEQWLQARADTPGGRRPPPNRTPHVASGVWHAFALAWRLRSRQLLFVVAGT